MPSRHIHSSPAHVQVDTNTRILEREPFDADESDLIMHPLYRTMDAFLQERCVLVRV